MPQADAEHLLRKKISGNYGEGVHKVAKVATKTILPTTRFNSSKLLLISAPYAIELRITFKTSKKMTNKRHCYGRTVLIYGVAST